MDLSEYYRSWHRDAAGKMLFTFAMSKVSTDDLSDMLDNMLQFARAGMIDREKFAALVAEVGDHRPEAISKLALSFARGDGRRNVD